MARRGRGKTSWVRHGFEPIAPDSPDYFEHKVGWLLRRVRQDSESALLTRTRMREDKSKADVAASFYAGIDLLLRKFLDRDGNIDDGYEVLASHISERAFKKIALERFHLIDPLDPPSAGSEQK